MPYAGDLLTVDSTPIPGLKQYKVTYAKIWKDTERNMAGDVTSTLIGIFPQLELEIGGELSEDDASALADIFAAAYLTVTYFDPKSKATKTAQYYASDFSMDILDKGRGLYKPFTINLIPVSKQA